MRPTPVPRGNVEELRAAVRAFAQEPGPARFHRVCRLLESTGREGTANDADGLPY
jgi:hypothetical protein